MEKPSTEVIEKQAMLEVVILGRRNIQLFCYLLADFHPTLDQLFFRLDNYFYHRQIIGQFSSFRLSLWFCTSRGTYCFFGCFFLSVFTQWRNYSR